MYEVLCVEIKTVGEKPITIFETIAPKYKSKNTNLSISFSITEMIIYPLKMIKRNENKSQAKYDKLNG